MSSEDGGMKICDIAATCAAADVCAPNISGDLMAASLRNITKFINSQLFIGDRWSVGDVTYCKINLFIVLYIELPEHGPLLFAALRAELQQQTQGGVYRTYRTDIETDKLETHGTITIITRRCQVDHI